LREDNWVSCFGKRKRVVSCEVGAEEKAERGENFGDPKKI